MPEGPDYAQLVAQAEKAVTAVTDPELKRIAFQKVLDDLLVTSSESHGGKPPVRRKTKERGSPTKKANRHGPQGYVEEMIDDGFFKKPKTIAQVKAELENRGHHIALTSLSGPLQKLCQRRKLRRQKATLSGNKQTFAYSEW
jgi:hypothetical protein